MGFQTTIDADGPWEYLDLLNECLKIGVTVGLGFLFGHLKIFDPKAFIPQATRFIFYVALPLLVLRALVSLSVDNTVRCLFATINGVFKTDTDSLLCSSSLSRE